MSLFHCFASKKKVEAGPVEQQEADDDDDRDKDLEKKYGMKPKAAAFPKEQKYFDSADWALEKEHPEDGHKKAHHSNLPPPKRVSKKGDLLRGKSSTFKDAPTSRFA